MTRLLPVLALLACSTEGNPDPIGETPLDPVEQPGTTPATVVAGRTAPQAIVGAFEPRNTWSSTPITQSADGTQVYTLDRDNNTLVALASATGTVQTVELGGTPSHVARLGDDLLVTLRSDRLVVRVSSATLQVIDTVELGAEPMGIVARPDGQRVYVALSQDHQVVELDADLQVLARVDVPREPRYLALHPEGQRLFIGSGRGEARLTELDLITLSTISLPLPFTQRQTMGPAGVVELKPRITGDLAISRIDGRAQLAVPVLYADTITPVPDIADPDEIEEAPDEPFFPGEGDGGYGGGGGTDVDRLNPAIVTVDVEADATTLAPPILAVSPIENGFTNADFEFVSVRSYINHLSFGPGGRILATMEAEGAALVFDPSVEVFSESFIFPPEAGGFRTVSVAAARVGAGALGALYTGPDQAFAVSAFDLQVAPLPIASLHQRVDDLGMMGFLEAMPPVELDAAPVVFGTSPLSPQVQLGRRLFFSADNPSMGAGGVSCSTCHFEGRNDGITWTFDGGLRQTPSLAGVVSDTAPVTWTSNVATVAMEADITTRGRMGGGGLNDAELAAIEAFVDTTPLPDIPTVQSSIAVARGAVVFQEAGCAACHNGDALTDNNTHTLRGMALNTPKLRGVAGSAPYLVDGSAETLREVLELASQPGNMGSTAGLSPAQLDDLEAYLLTL